VVDDNEVFREILSQQLSRWGLHATQAADGDEALKRLAHAVGAQPFDIVLLDSGMPGLAGVELARAIRSNPAISARIVLMSSLESAIGAEELKSAGVDHSISKPLRQSNLLDAISRAVGSGADATATVSKSNEPSPVTIARILLAEDNEVNQMVAVEVLRRAGFHCDVVSDGREAVDAVMNRRYDAVLMDCHMPKLSGLEAALEIRRREANGPGRVPIIALTANALRGDRDACLAAGMDDYLVKPLEPPKLITMLNRFVSHQRPDAAPVQPTKPETPIDSSPIDMPALLARCLDDEQFRSRLLEKFVTQSQEMLKAIGSALEAGNLEQLRIAAHSMKGSAASMSATSISQVAAGLETLASAGALRDAQARLEELAAEVERCVEFISKRGLPAHSPQRSCNSPA
jgi:CheY-like chemotaxis protein/HPt (histidine-containing phosphotransfer) domain-containing protein